MVTDDLIEQLIQHEGLRLKPYKDTVGKLTIGVGRNLTDVGITRDEALAMLNDDILQCVEDLQSFSWWVFLNEVQQRALIDMRFNLGADGFRGFKNMIVWLSLRQYKSAANEMRSSKWFRQVKDRGRVLAAMIETGKDL